MTRTAAKQLVDHLEKIQTIIIRINYGKDVHRTDFDDLEQSLDNLKLQLGASFGGTLEGLC